MRFNKKEAIIALILILVVAFLSARLQYSSLAGRFIEPESPNTVVSPPGKTPPPPCNPTTLSSTYGYSLAYCSQPTQPLNQQQSAFLEAIGASP